MTGNRKRAQRCTFSNRNSKGNYQGENRAMPFHTKSGTLIASEQERVVVGERGPYVEFSPEQVNMNALRFIPFNEKGNRHVYFHEYRSNDLANVMVYHQRRTVKYADYRVGMFYVAPNDLAVHEVEN
jgi:hypothetical protein